MSAQVMKIIDVRLTILESNPPQLVIDVIGSVNSTGWTNPTLEPRYYIDGSPADGIQDFDFVADAPTGIVLWVITPIRFSLTIHGGFSPSVKGIRIHSAANSVEKRFDAGNVTSFVL